MKDKKKLRVILEVAFIIVFLLIGYHLIQEHAPKVLEMLESGNAKEIDSYLAKYGTEGKFLLIILQIIETVSIVLPAVPVYICSGMLFGKLCGILVCYATNLVLNILIFLAAHRLKESTHHVFNIENQKTIHRLMQSAKHLDRVVLAMCLLPIVPNGMIPYLSAQTSISVKDFTKALAVGSLPSIIMYVCCGDILISESYKIIIPIVIILVIVTLIAFLFRKKLAAVLEPKLKQFVEG